MGQLLLALKIGSETDAASLRWVWVHELSDRRKHGSDGIVVSGEFLLDPGFELIETLGEILVRADEFT